MTDEDDRMDALLRQMAAEEYNRPPQIVPREQMWEAVLQGLGNPAKQDAGTVLPFRSRVPRPCVTLRPGSTPAMAAPSTVSPSA